LSLAMPERFHQQTGRGIQVTESAKATLLAGRGLFAGRGSALATATRGLANDSSAR
jgi:hypothetical protein